MTTIGVPDKCPRCGADVTEWRPWNVAGRLHVVLYPCRHQVSNVEMIFPTKGKQKPF